MDLAFPYKTTPRDHQREEFEFSKNLVPRGLWWEMGVGKTKPTLDTISHLTAAREISGVAILAPPGVHENWILDEIPKHLHDGVAEQTRCFIWETKKAGAKYFRDAFAEFMKHDGLAILAMTYYAIMTDAGALAMKKFLKSRRVLYVADEATAFSRPGAKTTMRVRASAAYADYRRVLNGTPVADSPFQAYSQVRFVQPDAWKERFEIQNFEDFKAFFGRWEKRGNDKVSWPQLLHYRNLELMHEVVDSVGSRLLLSDVMDLPPKSYQKIYFDLSPAQRRMYDQLAKEMRSEFPDGAEITADLAIVQLTRFQQICSGYAPADDEEDLRRIDEKNQPRLDVLRELVLTVPRKAIIWAKYNVDIDIVREMLRKAKLPHVVYDGRTSIEGRQFAKRAFQEGDARFFVAKPKAAGRGLTLTAANVAIYYNNGYSLDDRLQSEGRIARIGQEHPMIYYDIVARETVDEKILAALRRKRKLAAMVTGDELQEWV